MNHDRDKASILDVLLMMLLIVFFTGMATFSLLGGGLFPALLLGSLGLLITWLLIRDLRYGVRPPTRWEWFKAWMNVRPILIGAIGFAFFMSLLSIDRDTITVSNDTFGIVITGITLVWGGLLFYSMWRAQRPRLEDDATYKKRIGWKDQ